MLAVFWLSAWFPSGGEAPWSSVASRSTSGSREIFGFPSLRSRPDPGAADLGVLQRVEEEAAAGVRGQRVEDLGRAPQSWSGGSLGASPGRYSSVRSRSISAGMVVDAARQRLTARSSPVLRVSGAGGWCLRRRRRWRTAPCGVIEDEVGLVLQCFFRISLCISLSSSFACLILLLVVIFLV